MRCAVVLAALTGFAGRGLGEPTETPLFVAGQDGYHTYRIPALIATPQGALLAFCEARKNSAADHGDVDLVMKRSDDSGATWSRMQILVDDGAKTIGNPCPVVDRRTGVVTLPYCRDNRDVFVLQSRDDGKTWSRPSDVTASFKDPAWGWIATGPGVGVQTKSGRLVVPCDNKTGKARFSHAVFSDDGGATWTRGANVGPDCNECQIAARVDGSLLLNMRSYRGTGRRLVAVSADGGKTFSAPTEDGALVEPVCQASLLRLGEKGEMLFANPASTKRNKLTVRLSLDDGKTWPHAKLLNAGPSAYSSLAALSNDAVFCLYERGTKTPYESLVLARFSRSWLANEKRE